VERGTLVSDALVLRGGGDPARSPAIAEGRATPQDQASQAVVRYLAPESGERILDVAAAPGGKATACAERVGASGRVFACDRNAGRLRLVGTAAERLGLDNVDLAVVDGRHPTIRSGGTDRVLIDARCSGLGVLRRRPEARWRIDPASIDELATLQRALVLAAAPAVRIGGTLVYAVCTLTSAETRDVGAALVRALPDFRVLDPPAAPWRPWGPGALLLPSAERTDGMYVLGLRREAG
jgi:16S rRNA (cytosine967-C5)-methyltransferase